MRRGSTIGVMSFILSDGLIHQLVDCLLCQIDLAEGVGKCSEWHACAACASFTATDIIAIY
eukprot:13953287-Ditylum_brightwellii.AAC.1